MPLHEIDEALVRDVTQNHPKLGSLSLKDNKLTEVGPHLRELRYLVKLDLSNNVLHALAGLDLPRLVELKLGGNLLHSLEGVAGCPALEFLDVSHNSLVHFDEIQHLANLKHLKASGNPSQTTHSELQSLAPTLERIELDTPPTDLSTTLSNVNVSAVLQELGLQDDLSFPCTPRDEISSLKDVSYQQDERDPLQRFDLSMDLELNQPDLQPLQQQVLADIPEAAMPEQIQQSYISPELQPEQSPEIKLIKLTCRTPEPYEAYRQIGVQADVDFLSQGVQAAPGVVSQGCDPQLTPVATAAVNTSCTATMPADTQTEEQPPDPSLLTVIRECRQEVEESAAKLVDMERKLQLAREHVTLLQKEHSALKADHSTLSCANTLLRSEINATEQSIVQHEKQGAASQATIVTQQQTIHDLQVEKKALLSALAVSTRCDDPTAALLISDTLLGMP